MDSLCGSKFWDSNLTVYTENPDLTPCFQNTLLAWVPCIYLWVALPCYLLYLRHHHHGYIVLSHLSRLKTTLGVLLWCVSWADLFYSFHSLIHGGTPAPIFFITPLVVGITMVLATLLIQYERLRGVQSSGLLIIFWFLCVVCAIVPFRSKILSAVAEGAISDPFRFSTFFIYFALVLSALILSCFREKSPLFSPKNEDPNRSPEASAGFLSRLTFWWFTSLAILGYRRPLEDGDLWSLKEEDCSHKVVQQLLEAWQKQERKTAGAKAAEAGKKITCEDEVLLGGKPRAREPSFLWALGATFGSSFLIGSLYKLIQDLLSFVNPQLLRSRYPASLVLPLGLGPGGEERNCVILSKWHMSLHPRLPTDIPLLFGGHTMDQAWVPSRPSSVTHSCSTGAKADPQHRQEKRFGQGRTDGKQESDDRGLNSSLAVT